MNERYVRYVLRNFMPRINPQMTEAMVLNMVHGKSQVDAIANSDITPQAISKSISKFNSIHGKIMWAAQIEL